MAYYTCLVFVVILLYASISPSISSSSPSDKDLQGDNEEALALLKWKSSLHKRSQSLLSSWQILLPSPSNHCTTWLGISCNKAGRIHNITIPSLSLTGGSGAVYKVEVPGGQVFAVKKLHSLEHEELKNQKAFTSEIRALAKIRHRNIVKLYGFCSHVRNSFLVYEFLEGGNLEKILNNEIEALNFEWIKRIDVIKGIVNGMAYMHHECSPPIVHRDISSKNILLDSEYVAHISDFGTARILRANSTNCTAFAGTFGYAAPELAYTMEVNEMQDVYSFGVLTLEVLMGRHPSDLVSYFFTSLSSSLPSSSIATQDVYQTLLKDILDPRLPLPKSIRESKEIVCAAKLAFACLQVIPHHRPTMKQVSTQLSKQRQPLQSSFSTITLGQLPILNV